MPPKVKITKEDIIKTTVALVKKEGEQAINARTIAAALNCSTQPIFSNFKTMGELRQATIEASYELYLSCLQREVESQKYPPYKAYGMAYIRFAHDEKELFKLLFMRDRSTEDTSLISSDFEVSEQMIMKANGVSKETAHLIHLEMWICVHGIGVMIATSYLPLEWNLISDMLTDIYQGVRARHVTKEKKDDGNSN